MSRSETYNNMMRGTASASPGRGHNRPVVDLYAALEPEALGLFLDERFTPRRVRGEELLAAHTRFVATTRDGIGDDVMAGKAADFSAQIRKEVVEVEAVRVAIKAPVLLATKQIDGYGRALCEPLVAARQDVEGKLGSYMLAKEAAARQAAEEEAARASEAAQAAMDAAAATGEADAQEAAVEAVGELQAAEATATASVAELSRTRGAGSVAGLRDHWEHEIVDLSKVPSHFLMLNEKVVRAAIASGAREIPGLRIYNAPRVAVR